MPEVFTILCIAIPLGAIPLIIIFGNHPNLRESISLFSSAAMCVAASLVVSEVLSGGSPTVIFWEIIPNLPLFLKVEPIGALFCLVSSFLWIVSSLYSLGYMRANNEQNQTRFFAYFSAALGCSAGIAFSGNILTLFLFYEALTLSTYPLVTHSGTPEAQRSGRIYLGILLTTSIMLLLLAMLWTWIEIGSLDFIKGGILSGKVSDGTAAVLLILFIFGVGKAAIMPFHRWLPAAMVAPAPVSALLHAVAVVKAGVFTILKLTFYIFGFDTITESASGSWLIYVAGFTIIAASLVALREDNLKLRLAYSTIGQLSYIVLAASLANAQAFSAGAFHIAAHAFGKITLFFCAGAIYTAMGKTKVSELRGIGRSMPITMTAFIIGSLVMIGLPPTAGFVTKWNLINGALNADNWFAISVIIIGTILTTSYLAPIIILGLKSESHQKNSSKISTYSEAPLTMLLAIVITSIISITMFIYPDWATALSELATEGQ